ncbi:unnamed protein product [Acanthosepion pharaonis]|uniref:Uncharacterized protein n=1 Tax=Acanthosepion pharaonis TaxID=158019 RepID=A0A812AR47_ACAPH|nr:unnamed protein product [Sepia pharaonis]
MFVFKVFSVKSYLFILFTSLPHLRSPKSHWRTYETVDAPRHGEASEFTAFKIRDNQKTHFQSRRERSKVGDWRARRRRRRLSFVAASAGADCFITSQLDRSVFLSPSPHFSSPFSLSPSPFSLSLSPFLSLSLPLSLSLSPFSKGKVYFWSAPLRCLFMTWTGRVVRAGSSLHKKNSVSDPPLSLSLSLSLSRRTPCKYVI